MGPVKRDITKDFGIGRSGIMMWEYIVIGHAVLTIYLVINMYNTLRMGVICDPIVLLENHYENHL